MNVREAELRLEPIAHRVLVVNAKTRRRNGQVLTGMLRLDLRLHFTLLPLFLLFRCHSLFPRSAHAGNRLPVLDADAFLGSTTLDVGGIGVEPRSRSGRLA